MRILPSIMQFLLSFIGIILVLFGILVLAVGVSSKETALIIIGVVIVILAIVLIVRAIQKYNKQQQPAAPPFIMTEEQLQLIAQDQLPIVENTTVMLRANEVAHYITPAWLSITQQKVLGSTGGVGGLSFRVAKGVYLHSGKSASRRIYGDVTNTYQGDLVITNQRVVFLQGEKGFEFPIKNLTALTPIEQGIALQHKSKTYNLLVPAPEYPCAVLSMVFNQC